MKNIQKIKLIFRQHVYFAVVAELLFAIALTAIPFAKAGATGLLSARSITMSDSGPSGSSITTGEGDGANVVYKIGFTAASTAVTVGGIAIDFCTNSPLLFDTCTAPTALNTNYASTSINNQTNLGTGAMAVYTGATAQLNNRIVISRASPATIPGTGTSFELGNGTTNGFTNPSTTGTFYARVYTYDTAAHAQAHVPGTTDAFYVDFGGVALATATVITITARVQENIIFCVSAAAPTSNCGGTSAPSVSIGHNTNKVIDSSVIDTGTVYTQLSTNAGSGANVRIHSSSATGGLDTASGGNIPPVGAGASSPTLMVAGTAAFGLKVAAGSGGTGTVTASSPYNSVVADTYGLDTTTSGANAITTYGSLAESASAPTSNVNNQWTFAATASNTTPAGLYTANIAVIATGTF